MSKRTLFLALPVAAAMVLSACGGSAAERPSADEIADVLTEGTEELGGVAVPQEQADCIADVFVNSDLSDEALRAMVEGDEDYEATDEDQAALTDLMADPAVTECVVPSS
jgi:hypothetical protein